MDAWENASEWYAKTVGEKGHEYHRAFLLKGLLSLLSLKKGDSLLDIGCGQGVLARALPKEVRYTGIDAAPSLLREAKKLSSPDRIFLEADATQPLPVEGSFDAACFLLSLQNMERGDLALLHAGKALKTGGKAVLIVNHPCFRIPRQSSWGVDEPKKLQYRRLDSYLSPQKIPIQTHPGKDKGKTLTYSYHTPLSLLFQWCKEAGFSATDLQEWCSEKKSEGAKAKMEDRARREFPLFLALCLKKGG